MDFSLIFSFSDFSFFKFFSLLIPLFNIRVLAHESNEDVLFNHGVASGDPTHDKVIIWSKITKDTNRKIKADWQVSNKKDFSNIRFCIDG